MSRRGQTHCNNRCRAPRCKGLSKRSGFKSRCCLCTKHASGLCRWHQSDGPRTTTRKEDHAATVGNGVEVRQSQISQAGNGLFATWSFASNDIITEYAGTQMSREEARTSNNQTHIMSAGAGGATPLIVSGLQQPVEGRGGGSFANDPDGTRFTVNAESIRGDTEHGFGQKIFLKVKPGMVIRQGEEIFLNYGGGEFGGRSVAMGQGNLR